MTLNDWAPAKREAGSYDRREQTSNPPTWMLLPKRVPAWRRWAPSRCRMTSQDDAGAGGTWACEEAVRQRPMYAALVIAAQRCRRYGPASHQAGSSNRRRSGRDPAAWLVLLGPADLATSPLEGQPARLLEAGGDNDGRGRSDKSSGKWPRRSDPVDALAHEALPP
jgi:hypothetical protein